MHIPMRLGPTPHLHCDSWHFTEICNWLATISHHHTANVMYFACMCYRKLHNIISSTMKVQRSPLTYCLCNHKVRGYALWFTLYIHVQDYAHAVNMFVWPPTFLLKTLPYTGVEIIQQEKNWERVWHPQSCDECCSTIDTTLSQRHGRQQLISNLLGVEHLTSFCEALRIVLHSLEVVSFICSTIVNIHTTCVSHEQCRVKGRMVWPPFTQFNNTSDLEYPTTKSPNLYLD